MKLRIIFPIILVVVAAILMISLRHFSLRTILFPLLVGIPLALLSVAQAAREVSSKKVKQKAPTKMEIAQTESRHNLQTLLWIGTFLTTIYVLGFLVGIPAYIAAYIKLHKGKWLSTALISGAVASLLILLTRVLEVTFYDGQLFKLFYLGF